MANPNDNDEDSGKLNIDTGFIDKAHGHFQRAITEGNELNNSKEDNSDSNDSGSSLHSDNIEEMKKKARNQRRREINAAKKNGTYVPKTSKSNNNNILTNNQVKNKTNINALKISGTSTSISSLSSLNLRNTDSDSSLNSIKNQALDLPLSKSLSNQANTDTDAMPIVSSENSPSQGILGNSTLMALNKVGSRNSSNSSSNSSILNNASNVSNTLNNKNQNNPNSNTSTNNSGLLNGSISAPVADGTGGKIPLWVRKEQDTLDDMKESLKDILDALKHQGSGNGAAYKNGTPVDDKNTGNGLADLLALAGVLLATKFGGAASQFLKFLHDGVNDFLKNLKPPEWGKPNPPGGSNPKGNANAEKPGELAATENAVHDVSLLTKLKGKSNILPNEPNKQNEPLREGTHSTLRDKIVRGPDNKHLTVDQLKARGLHTTLIPPAEPLPIVEGPPVAPSAPEESLLSKLGKKAGDVRSGVKNLASGAIGTAAKMALSPISKGLGLVANIARGVIGAEGVFHAGMAYKDWNDGKHNSAIGEGAKSLGTFMMGGETRNAIKGIMRLAGGKKSIKNPMSAAVGLAIAGTEYFAGQSINSLGGAWEALDSPDSKKESIWDDKKKAKSAIINNARKEVRDAKSYGTVAAGIAAGALAGGIVGSFIPVPFVGTAAGIVAGGAIGGGAAYYSQHKEGIDKFVHDPNRMGNLENSIKDNVINTLHLKELGLVSDTKPNSSVTQQVAKASNSIAKPPQLNQNISSTNTTNINIASVSANNADEAKRNLREALRQKDQADAERKRVEENYSNIGGQTFLKNTFNGPSVYA